MYACVRARVVPVHACMRVFEHVLCYLHVCMHVFEHVLCSVH